jgi:hypothetical protein
MTQQSELRAFGYDPGMVGRVGRTGDRGDEFSQIRRATDVGESATALEVIGKRDVVVVVP